MNAEDTIATIRKAANGQITVDIARHDAADLAHKMAPSLNAAMEHEGATPETAVRAMTLLLAWTITTCSHASEDTTAQICGLLRAHVASIRNAQVTF